MFGNRYSNATGQRLLLVLLLVSTPCSAITPTEIKTALQPKLAQRLQVENTQITLKPLPAFVRNATCDGLQADVRGNLSHLPTSGSLPVQIQCQQPRQWSAYVSASIATATTVVTACHSLPRNTPLLATDLCVVERPTAPPRQHALHTAREAIGMSLKRPLTAGAILYRSTLTASTLIKRGDGLVIESRRGQAVIAVRGTALQPGTHGEQITVQNAQSGRRLSAWVIAPGLVSASGPPGLAGRVQSQTRDISGIRAKVPIAAADTPIENPAMVGKQTDNK